MRVDEFAEQSVIGGLLLEPERFDDVREWLEVEDFSGHREAQAYQAMITLAASNHAITPEAVNRQLMNLSDRPNSADAPFLVSCMSTCPVAARTAVYGRMVLETSIRRRVSEQAAGLRYRAEQAVTSTDLNLVFARVDAVRRDVERLHLRETRADGVASPSPLNVDNLAPLPVPDSHCDANAERTAVMALVHQPRSLARVSKWLNASDFHDPECAVVYRELLEMGRQGQPIDALTVAWRIHQTDLRGPVSEALVGPPNTTTLTRPDATRAARAVLEGSVRGSIIDTARALEKSNEGVTSERDATGEAYARLNSLWPYQRRLIRAGMSSA